jgi:hypothetical protein
MRAGTSRHIHAAILLRVASRMANISVAEWHR